VFKADLKTRLYDGAAKSGGAALQTRPGQARLPKSWRQYRPPAQG
jgi:hypothetical protein